MGLLFSIPVASGSAVGASGGSTTAFDICPLHNPLEAMPQTNWQQTGLMCPDIFSSTNLRSKITLSKPSVNAQQELAQQAVLAIQNITAADPTVSAYFDAVFRYMPDLEIKIINDEEATVKGTIGTYTPEKRTLEIPVQKNFNRLELYEALRHEMRHCFWNLVHATSMKDDLFSAECFYRKNSQDTTMKNLYDKAVASDINFMKSLQSKLPKNSTSVRQLYDNNPAVRSAYNLKADYKSNENLNAGSITSNNPANARAKITSKKNLSSGLFQYTIVYENPLMAALHIAWEIETITLPEQYMPEVWSYEREALLRGKLPDFLIAFLYPNLTAFLSRVLANVTFSLATPFWPTKNETKYDSSFNDFMFKFQRGLATPEHIKNYMSSSPENQQRKENIIYKTFEEFLSFDEKMVANHIDVIIYGLIYISSNYKKFENFPFLLEKAVNIRERNAGTLQKISTAITGAFDRLPNDMACRAYLRAFKDGELTPQDYVDCLTRLKDSRNAAHFGKFKLIKHRGLQVCNASLLDAHDWHSAQAVEHIRDQINALQLT